MGKGRLEAFSDGILAIIITIMILEMKIPHDDHLSDLKPLIPVFLSYVMSFVYLAIYWNNHHHMLHAAKHVNGPVLWANIHLLFWLSLVPFMTGWMGETNFSKWPVILYGINLLFAGIAYYILSQLLIKLHGKDSTLAKAIGSDFKGKLSIWIYVASVGLSFVHPLIGFSGYIVVALIWFIPDKRIEKYMSES
jgi:uncharacterized membrane protein